MLLISPMARHVRSGVRGGRQRLIRRLGARASSGLPRRSCGDWRRRATSSRDRERVEAKYPRSGRFLDAPGFRQRKNSPCKTDRRRAALRDDLLPLAVRQIHATLRGSAAAAKPRPAAPTVSATRAAPTCREPLDLNHVALMRPIMPAQGQHGGRGTAIWANTSS